MTLDFSPGSNLPFKLPDLATRLFPSEIGKSSGNEVASYPVRCTKNKAG